LSTARYIVSKRKIPRNRKVSGVFLLPGNIKIMKNNSILKYGYLMKSLLLNEEEPIYGNEYYGAAEPPVRCGESHLSGLTEPPHFVY
ncbi:hypothetical protein, partial [Blautia wexlerae]|uniref:hypothetical protein n=1 Tax=Blautia wexlerae TaxID=418240 RepID=UPI0034A2C1D1